MNREITALERAFQLAGSGSCKSISDIKRRLKAEGYASAQVDGPALRKQLRSLMKGARDLGAEKDDDHAC